MRRNSKNCTTTNYLTYFKYVAYYAFFINFVSVLIVGCIKIDSLSSGYTLWDPGDDWISKYSKLKYIWQSNY